MLRILAAFALVTCHTPTVAFLNPEGKRSADFRSKSVSLLHASRETAGHLVALTREDGKNGKLQKALAGLFETVEVPCIAHADGPDLATLPDRLKEPWDYVIVTSPEAAKVVASAWGAVADNPPKVAAVGKATEETLNEYGIEVCFTPSKATAAVLVVELPAEAPCKIMYPASCKAKYILEDGLAQRGFDVVRLNTYDTVTASWTGQEKETAKRCSIACFGSPSSVHGWLQNTDNDRSVLAACIGETSASACREKGWPEERIFFPDKPGIPGWVEAVENAAESLHLSQA